MKYIALILGSIATALLVAALVGFSAHNSEHLRSLPPQVSVPEPTAEQFKAQADLMNALQALVAVSASDAAAALAQHPNELLAVAPVIKPLVAAPSAPVPVTPAPVTPVTTVKPISTAAQTSQPQRTQPPPAPPTAAPAPVVSVILAAGSQGKAIVNGHLVQVGDRLDNGLSVRDIQIDSVTFVSHQGKRLTVRVPLERLRILGAYPVTPAITPVVSANQP